MEVGVGDKEIGCVKVERKREVEGGAGWAAREAERLGEQQHQTASPACIAAHRHRPASLRCTVSRRRRRLRRPRTL